MVPDVFRMISLLMLIALTQQDGSVCPELQPALQSNREQGVPEGCRGDPPGKVKLNILITWQFYCKNTHKNTPELTGEGEVWGALREYKVWPPSYFLTHCSLGDFNENLD